MKYRIALPPLLYVSEGPPEWWRCMRCGGLFIDTAHWLYCTKCCRHENSNAWEIPYNAHLSSDRFPDLPGDSGKFPEVPETEKAEP